MINTSDSPPNRTFPPSRFHQWERRRPPKDGLTRHRPLKEGQQEDFSKESSRVRMARQTYQESHPTDFRQEGSHDLSSVFCKMASSAHLLDSSIFEVQDTWCRQKDLKAANWVAKNSHKCIHFFSLVSPMESPKIMGLQDIHSPDTLCHHGGLEFCPWCGKEGQNEGTIVNHLQIAHYQLGLICNGCLYYFTTSSDIMHCHGQGCKNLAGGEVEEDDEDEEHNKDTDDDSTLD